MKKAFEAMNKSKTFEWHIRIVRRRGPKAINDGILVLVNLQL